MMSYRRSVGLTTPVRRLRSSACLPICTTPRLPFNQKVS